MFKRIIPLLSCLSAVLTGCELLVVGDTDPEERLTDWDWAEETACRIVEEEYGEGWFIHAFGAEYLDKDGTLYQSCYSPIWWVEMINGTTDFLIIEIDDSGECYFDYHELYTPEEQGLLAEYHSDQVRMWINKATQYYQIASGRDDVAYYSVDCDTVFYLEDDEVTLILYNTDQEKLAYIEIEASSGEIDSLDIF